MGDAGWVLIDAGHQRQGVDNWERTQFRLGSYHAVPADTYYPTRESNSNLHWRRPSFACLDFSNPSSILRKWLRGSRPLVQIK